MKQVTLHIIFLLLCESVCVQVIFPETMDRPHPRLISEDVNLSRLQMYWESHATDVFIKGGIYSHAEGYAPAPTVRFAGARDPTTNYLKPKLDHIFNHTVTRQWSILEMIDCAYDYIWDKKSVMTNKDFYAIFNLDMEGEEQSSMRMWMKGEENREILIGHESRKVRQI